MWARFELYSSGLVALPAPAPRQRSIASACLSCRKRKKRCDDQISCQQCRTLHQACVRVPSDTGKPSATPRPDNAAAQADQVDDVEDCNFEMVRIPDQARLIFGQRNHQSLIRTQPQTQQFSTLSDSKLPSCSLTTLLEVFDHFSTGHYLGPSLSMLNLSLPLLCDSPVWLHSWISCSASVLLPQNPEWQQIGIKHQNLAISGLNKSLSSGDLSFDVLAAVMTLHLSEPLDWHTRLAKRVHIRAAYDCFYRYYTSRVPASVLETLLLESLLYHVSIAATFLRTHTLPEDAFDTLMSFRARSTALRDPTFMGFSRSLLGGLDTVTMRQVHDVGQTLNRQASQEQLVSLRHSLGDLVHINQQKLCGGLDWDDIIFCSVQRLYLVAAQILLDFTTRLTNEVTGTEDSTHDLFKEGMRLLQLLQPASAVVAYPLAIIGTLALTEVEKHTVQDIVMHTERLGHKTVLSIRDLWQHAWAARDVAVGKGAKQSNLERAAALSVFSDHEFLTTVIL